MQEFDWTQRYKDKITTAPAAMRLIKSGNSIFIGTGCAQPQHLVNALVEHSSKIYDAHIIHLLTMGTAPYAHEKFREKFKMNSFFIADNVRDAFAKGIGDYTPIFLSEIPLEFETGRIPVDVALISVTPPDVNGLCSLGVSVDIVKSAAANAKYVIAQVNTRMPRTFGDCFVHVNAIDVLVPHDEDIIEIPVPESDDTLRRIGQNIARLVEDGSTIECGIGRIPQALAEFLKDKKDLGIHTEMFSDWIIDLIECGAITCAKKSLNRGKIIASFCMGSKRLYDYVDNNPLFEFYPTEYVNDVHIIGQHEKMVGINVGLEIDLTGQVCSDSLGYQFYSGIGGQVDFIRGAARSRGGKAIIAMPSTARDDQISRIVPRLTEGAGVVTTRGDVHYVVTEYGVAYLHGKSIRERVMDLGREGSELHLRRPDRAGLGSGHVSGRAGAVRYVAGRHGNILQTHQTDRRAGPLGNDVFAEREIGPDPLHDPYDGVSAQRYPAGHQYRLSAGYCHRRRRSSRLGRGDCRHRPVLPRSEDPIGGGGVSRAGRMAAQGHGDVSAGLRHPNRQTARRQEVLGKGLAEQ